MLNIIFDNLLQIREQGRVTCKVTNDDHYQLICLLVIDDSTSFGVDSILEFGWAEHMNGIPLMALIGLGALFDMVSPQVGNRF